MEQFTKEKTDSRAVPQKEKRQWGGGGLRPMSAVLRLCGRVADYFGAHEKKSASLPAVLLFFVLSSSFSFPLFSDAPQALQADSESPDKEADFFEDGEEPKTASAWEITVEEAGLLDDADVMDGYEDAELEHVGDVDKYTLDEILEETGKTAEQTVPAADVSTEDAVFDRDDWRLLLINKQHPIPEDYTFELGTIKGSMKCDKRIIDDLLAMLQAARDDGINLVICSPYRDLNRQKVLFARKVKAYMDKGMSYIDAYKISSQAVTVPGASEHQIGLALDIVCTTYYMLNEGFSETEAGKWLQAHSYEYGFTLRYPRGKEYITGIEYEPWHFRYVGKEAAAVMKEKGICLEEFLDSL